MKVAIVHDWCVVYGGAERVLEHIIDCYPDADIFSLIDYVPEDQRHFLRGKKPQTSFLQRIPFVEKIYRKLLFLMPFAIEQFDLSDYDLVISSSYCVAKGVLTGPNQVHVSYCHSPMRYAWDHYHEYLRETGLEHGPLSWFARWQLHRIRTWDVRSSNTVDRFVANSRFVQARIDKFYRRESNVVCPPVETGLFTPVENKEDFYVAAGRFVPFKRLDLAVDAFTSMPDKRLIMIGDGPEMAKLRKKAGPNVEFIGFQPPEVMHDYLSRAKAFIFPSEEDFGIVPVEAQACGTPVIAFGSGGALETVVGLNTQEAHNQPVTGVFFERQSPASLIAAVNRFEVNEKRFFAQSICAHAADFSPEHFKQQLCREVDQAFEERIYKPVRPAVPVGSDRLQLVENG
ncbi:MAG: glycosyltransferase family 4 protein [Gammaproteobacteria bacterium]|nr:glycosyltransferase family 4 protein [Gammaproteobacteria bacterium]